MSDIQPYLISRTAANLRRGDSDSAWDSAVERFASPQPSKRIQDGTNAFKQFFANFTSQSKKPEIKDFRLRTNYTVNDVQREANAALEAYRHRGTSRKLHFLQTTGRDFSNNASAFEALLEFIPNGDYGAVACGALTLIFNAAKRVHDIREQVLNCLGTLTRTVQGTKGFKKLYAGDLKLWEAAESLFLALLEAVQNILDWLDEKAWRHALGALFKQSTYKRPLEDKIKEALDTRAKEFHEHLEYCQHERIEKVHIGVDGILREVADIKEDVKLMQKNQEVQTGWMMRLCKGLLRDREWQFFQNEQMRGALSWLVNQANAPQLLLAPVKTPMISATQLTDVLQVPRGSLHRDLVFAIQYGRNLTPARQRGANALMLHPGFRHWLQSQASRILLVNGRNTQDAWNVMSPLTYFVGVFSTVLAQTAIPLICICGRYAAPDDALEGAEGVLRILCEQLLTLYGDTLDLSSIDYTFIDALKSGDIRYLSELFKSLLGSIILSSPSPCAIFCLLDGVSFLETAERRIGLESLCRFFQLLMVEVTASSEKMVLKIMLIFPNMSQCAYEWFSPDDILTLGDEWHRGGDGQSYGVTRLESVAQDLILQRSHSPDSYLQA